METIALFPVAFVFPGPDPCFFFAGGIDNSVCFPRTRFFGTGNSTDFSFFFGLSCLRFLPLADGTGSVTSWSPSVEATTWWPPLCGLDPAAAAAIGDTSAPDAEGLAAAISPRWMCRKASEDAKAAKTTAWTTVPVIPLPHRSCAQELVAIALKASGFLASFSQIACRPSISTGLTYLFEKVE